MRKVSAGLLLIALLLSGCQALDRLSATRPAPTLAPVSLPPESPTQTLTPSPGVTAAPTSAPAATQAGATPTATPMTLPTPTPARIMALGARGALTLRAAPGAASAVAATVSGSTVLWAIGRSSDGRWVLLSYGDPPARAWAAAADLNLFGDETTLPTAAATAAQATAAPSAGPEKTPGGSAAAGISGRVTGDRLNVRAGPGVNQAVLGQLAGGDTVSVLARSAEGDWLEIAWQNGRGWVAARYIALNGDAGALPASTPATSAVPAPANQPAAGPVRTGSAGKIAFQTASGGDIYIVNADGSGLRRVANGIDPAFSPDGARLAYARWGTSAGIFVLDLATGQERQVASATQPRSPTWSSDGARIAFVRQGGAASCYQTPMGCLDEAALSRALRGQDCITTPFGHYCRKDFPLVRTSTFGLSQVTVANSAWLDLAVPLAAQGAAWRPGQDEIAYHGTKGLDLLPLGGQPRSLVADIHVSSPAWSPDGQRMAVQNYLHDHADIFVLDASGQTQARLTQPAPLAEHAANNVSPTWSPDGRTILFVTDRDGAWRIYRMNADGSNQAPFLPGVLGNLPLRYDFAAEHMVTWGR